MADRKQGAGWECREC